MTFPLFAETYRIGNRNYRRNPYKHGASFKILADVGDTPDLYPDEEDDGPSCAAPSYEYKPVEEPMELEEGNGKNTREQRDGKEAEVCVDDPRVAHCNGRWIAKIDVPHGLMSRLIGTRGATRRHIEDSTGCRLGIPRRGQEGPVEVKSLIGLENVQRCLDQIEVIVGQGRSSARFTHFTAFPCNHPDVVESFNMFRDAILSSETVSPSMKHESLFTAANKLHLTITMMWLLDEADKKKAVDALEAAGEEIRSNLGGAPVMADICGVSIMNDDPYNVDVLYANICGEGTQMAADTVYRHMVAAGLTPEVEEGVSTTAHPVKLHMTVANSRYKAQKSDEKRHSFDAAVVLDEFKEYYFGTIAMERVAICCLNSLSSNGFYDELGSTALM